MIALKREAQSEKLTATCDLGATAGDVPEMPSPRPAPNHETPNAPARSTSINRHIGIGRVADQMPYSGISTGSLGCPPSHGRRADIVLAEGPSLIASRLGCDDGRRMPREPAWHGLDSFRRIMQAVERRRDGHA